MPAAASNSRPPAVATGRRVNSSDALAAAEHIHTPMGSLGTGRSTGGAPHISIFAASPRSDGGIELAAAYAASGGGGSLRSSAAGTPQAGAAVQQGGLVAKKNTPASAAETQLLLDRIAADGGGGSSTGGVHLRASYTGGGGTPNGFSPNAPAATAMRSRLTSAL